MGGKVLASAMKVLRCFSAARPEWGVTELSGQTGLSKSHICKILQGFVQAEFLVRSGATRRYRVGPTAFLVGSGFASGSELVRRAEPFLRELTRDANFTATLNVSENSRLLFVMAVHGAAGAHHSWPAGSYIPLHATAAGKVQAAFMNPHERRSVLECRQLPKITASTISDPTKLWAQLEETRRTGCAYTFGESTRKVGGIAAPVFDNSGDLAGAISLLFPIDRTTRDRNADLASIVRNTARRLSCSIGADRYPFA